MKIYNISPISNRTVFKSAPKMTKQAIADLAVFRHHIYEYKTGIRDLFLTTEKAKYKDIIVERLEREKLPYVIHELPNKDNINVYFGAQQCIDVVKSFNNPNLRTITPEQDFMLGIMLGYGRIKECERYLKILKGEIKLGHE